MHQGFKMKNAYQMKAVTSSRIEKKVWSKPKISQLQINKTLSLTWADWAEDGTFVGFFGTPQS